MIDAAGTRTVGDLLDDLADGVHAHSTLSVEAADGTTRSVTYAGLAETSSRIAAGFSAVGVGRGDRVVLALPNSHEAAAVWFALARLGAISVPVNVAFTARELRHVIGHSGARLGVAQPPAVELLSEAGLAVGDVVVIGAIDGARATYGELLGADTRDFGKPTADDVLELVFTSGTTAAPKAAMITHANCIFSGLQKSAAMSVTGDDRLLTALPLFHVNAQSALLAALTAGASVALLERYSATRYCEQLVAHGATLTSLVGTQVRTLLRQEPSEYDRAHNVSRAWFALNVTDNERGAFESRFGIRLLNGYGLTEAFTSVTQAPLHGRDCWPSVGKPLLERRVRVIDAAGSDAGVDEVGEILVGGVPGRTLMAGYWRDEAATADALRDGWLHTGDYGRIDDHGYLHFVERKANMIKRAGENVAATEVELVLLEHPRVAEAAVVGVPDPLRDEAVKAFVVPAGDAEPTPEELERHCAARLAPFKVPTLWAVVDELPRNSLGKVEHRRLRASDPIGAAS